MADVSDFRRVNLHLILARFPSQVKLAEKLGVSDSYLSQILKNKPIGPRKARDIEQQVGLERGFLDQNPSLRALRLAEPTGRYDDSAVIPQIPIVGTIGPPEGTDYSIPSPSAPCAQYLPFPVYDGGAYALTVVGTYLSQRAFAGEYLVVYPNAICEPGDPVVVRLIEGKTFAKQLVSEREHETVLDEFRRTELGPTPFRRSEIEFMHFVTAVVHRSCILWR